MEDNWRTQRSGRSRARNGFGPRGFRNNEPSGRRDNGDACNSWRSKYQRHMRVHNLVQRIDPDFYKDGTRGDGFFEAVDQRDISDLMEQIEFDGTINEHNYVPALSMLLKLEQAHQEIEMRKHDKLNTRLVSANPGRKEFGKPKANQSKNDSESEDEAPPLKFGIEVPGQAEGLLIDISSFVLIEPHDRQLSPSIERIESFIGDVVVLSGVNEESKLQGERLDVYFLCSRRTNEACKRALDELRLRADIRQIIFERNGPGIWPDNRQIIPEGDELVGEWIELGILPEPVEQAQRQTREPKIKFSDLDLMITEADRRLRNTNSLNPEQRQAIRGILEARCRPKPYIVFGPPGTGKTHTLVEAVAQICLRDEHATVLFCANSNTCVDQTYEKIIRTGVLKMKQEVVRIHSGEYMNKGDHQEARVVVTTNIKSGSIFSHPRFHFVFIDEAGHAHEPESLVPICKLADDGCLVLAGDPKQLGPVVQFELAGKNGLERSMLDRIIEWDMYKRHELSNKFDSRNMTKLIDCYRCDPRILQISNKLFYGNELRCLNRTPPSLLRILGLRSPVQVVFYKGGEEVRRHNSTSWENHVEINKCVDILSRLYKMGLTAEQIGIMSPYRRQVKEMRKKLEETLKGGLLSLLNNKRFLNQTKYVTMVPKDAYARDAANENIEAAHSELFGNLFCRHVEMIERVRIEQHHAEWNCKIDTVDSFQGNEREVVIFSPVRTSANRHLGFLDDARRFNVAMSRAKWLLIVVGNETVLNGSEYWKEFLCHAEEDIKEWPRQSTFDNPYEPDEKRPLFRKGRPVKIDFGERT